MKKVIIVLFLMLAALPPVFSMTASTQADTVRILGVGNSWTRDSMRWLSAIAASAGVPVIVGHAYLGGSTLEDQWHGISDTSYTYTHAGQQQKVHSTYQYWKYTASVNPEKIPSSGYKNGLAGCGVTLEKAVADEPWDWIVFQPEATLGGDWKRHLGKGADGYSLSALIAAVKGMMQPSAAARVRVALMVPFSYPKGCTDYRQRFLEVYNRGRTPEDQAGWDKLYEKQYRLIQQAAVRLCRALKTDACINVGKVIEAGRANPDFSGCGYFLLRRRDNTHLAEGLPMYMASLCYAYTLLGLKPDDISFFPSVTSDSIITGDVGATAGGSFSLTEDLAAKARYLTYNCLYECRGDRHPVAIVAHRGYWTAPGLNEAQNSVAALREAQDFGCWGSEFDVHLTADNIVVVNHDPTREGKEIQTTAYKELRNLSLSNGEPLPTLCEYLAQGVVCEKTMLVLELKPQYSQEREDIRRMIEMGVDFITTNDPPFVRQILGDMELLPPGVPR